MASTNISTEKMILLESYQQQNKLCSFCPNDQSDVIEDTNSGYFVCRNCGSIEDKYVIADTAEWRSFTEGRDAGNDPNRGGDAVSTLEGVLAGNIMTNDGGALYDTISRSNRSLVNIIELILYLFFSLAEKINIIWMHSK